MMGHVPAGTCQVTEFEICSAQHMLCITYVMDWPKYETRRHGDSIRVVGNYSKCIYKMRERKGEDRG